MASLALRHCLLWGLMVTLQVSRGRTLGNERGEHYNYIDHHTSSLSDQQTAYCNPLDQPLDGKEGVAPSHLRLRSVHLVIRHGARNANERIQNFPSAVLDCRWSPSLYGSNQEQATSFKHAMDDLGDSSGPGRDHIAMLGLYPDQDVCEEGQLTWIGILQLLSLGKFLRERYIDKMELLPEVPNAEDLYVRSTNIPRTFQSSHALLFSLFPSLDFAKLPIELSETSTLCSEKQSGLSCSCPMVSTLRGLYDEKKPSVADGLKESTARLMDVDKEDLPLMTDLIDALMTFSCFREELPCNDKRPSKCFDGTVVHDIWEDSARRRKETLDIPEFISYHGLSIYPLFYEVLKNMKRTSRGNPQPRFVLYSGHDTTLQSLAVALGFSTGEKPSFASRFAMELYSDHHDEFFLRIIKDGHDVTRQLEDFCGDHHLVDGLCPLDKFEQFLFSKELLLGKMNYSEACG